MFRRPGAPATAAAPAGSALRYALYEPRDLVLDDPLDDVGQMRIEPVAEDGPQLFADQRLQRQMTRPERDVAVIPARQLGYPRQCRDGGGRGRGRNDRR